LDASGGERVRQLAWCGEESLIRAAASTQTLSHLAVLVGKNKESEPCRWPVPRGPSDKQLINDDAALIRLLVVENQ
jgi:hypothetical protein